ncbi:MAG: bifunctional biotin--[acetyl-CoA-carboxylase] synthetase/biotin operon repressor, partial [Sporomusaceae bacterium]|nr:bifunctional biotin--[acetyl-CoA-carboxylase] synthetase/biotin operon repressor [Sporomusaceae bacterium]
MPNSNLLPGNIRPFLTTKLIGRDIFHYQELASTNIEAKRLAGENSAPDGALVIAETQNKGQGRLGRGWYSPLGKGVWVSAILRPAFKIAEAAKCTLLAAVAANRA